MLIFNQLGYLSIAELKQHSSDFTGIAWDHRLYQGEEMFTYLLFLVLCLGLLGLKMGRMLLEVGDHLVLGSVVYI